MGPDAGILQEKFTELGGNDMKRTGTFLAAVALLILPAQLTWAKCTPLINEGRELLSKANLPADEATKIKGLLDEAQK